ncbi:hypothetical protein RyT2_28130 [Pseudolactococcus yaeyamensis]
MDSLNLIFRVLRRKILFLLIIVVLGLVVVFLFKPTHFIKFVEERNMTKITKGQHFLPEYETPGKKVVADILTDAKNQSEVFGSKTYTLDPDAKETSDKKEVQFDKFLFTELSLRALDTKHYTEIKFSTAMDFEKQGLSALQSNVDSFRYDYDSKTGLTTRNTEYLKKDLVGLCVVHDSKDVTDKGTLKIKDGLMTWEMNEDELKRVNDNTSDDDFFFFIFQTKPKTAIK